MNERETAQVTRIVSPTGCKSIVSHNLRNFVFYTSAELIIDVLIIAPFWAKLSSPDLITNIGNVAP